MKYSYHILFISFIGIILLQTVVSFGFFGGSASEKKEEDNIVVENPVVPEEPKVQASSGSGSKKAKNPLMSDASPELFMKVASYLPDHPFQQFVSGETATVLLGLHNLWTGPVTVFGVSGAYYSPDFSTLVRNITTQKTWIKLAAKEQATFRFNLKPEMEASTLGLVLHIDYTDSLTEKTWHRVAAYNQTVEIMSPADSLFDLQSLFIYVLGCILLVGGLGLMRNTFMGNTKSSGSKKSSKGLFGLGSTFSSSSLGGGSSQSNASGASLGSSSVNSQRSASPDGSWTPLSANGSPKSEWIPDMHFDRKSPKMKNKKP